MTEHFVHFDTDPGIDDALALAAIAASDAELVSITTTFGNTDTLQATRNALGLLELLGLEDIPAAPGAAGRGGAAYSAPQRLHAIHGSNGLGGVLLPSSASPSPLPAHELIAKSARERGKDLAVVATGPLTNIADFIRLHPEEAGMCGRIIVMGGAFTRGGNATEWAEANIHKDAEAAEAVFSSGLDVHVVGLDVTEKCSLMKEETLKWTNAKGEVYREILETYFAFHGGGKCFLHDPSAVAMLLEPSLFTEKESGTAVWTGGKKEGMTRFSDSSPTCRVAIDVDRAGVEELLKGLWLRAFA